MAPPVCSAMPDPQAPAEIIPDTEDPAVYYICSNGIPHRFVCPEHMLFSAAEKACDWEWKVKVEDH